MSEKDILLEFAGYIQNRDNEIYDSKFISIYNELVNKYRISGALKAGSYAKRTILEHKGDLDIIFTIDNPEITDKEEFKNDLAIKLSQSFPYDHIERKKRSVFIRFRSGLSADVVYLTREEFEKEKGQINHVKDIDDTLRKIIVLIKYWKIKKRKDNIDSYKIEWNTIYSSETKIKERLMDSLAEFSLSKDEQNELINLFLAKLLSTGKKYMMTKFISSEILS